MDSIKIGIISGNRKLRFVYKLLLAHESEGMVDVVLEGLSLHELGGCGRGGFEPSVLLLDDAQIPKNQDVYFAYLRELFPNTGIILLTDTTKYPIEEGTDPVVGSIGKNCSVSTLVSTIRHAASCRILQ